VLGWIDVPSWPEGVRKAVELCSQLIQRLTGRHKRRLIPVRQFQFARRCLLDLDRILQGVCLFHVFPAVGITEGAEHQHHITRTDVVDRQRHLTRTILEHGVKLVLVNYEQRLEPVR